MVARTFTAFLLLTSSILHAQQSSKSARAPLPATPPSLFAPLFIENGDFTSDIGMVNASTSATYADVYIHDQRGHTVAQQRVQLPATSQTKVSVNDMLRAANSATTTGSVLITPSPTLKGMSIAALMMLTYQKYPQPSYIDEEFVKPSADTSQELHGVADAGDSAPIVAISNISQKPQHFSVTCLNEHGPSTKGTVDVDASGTAIIAGCDRGSSDKSIGDFLVDGEAHGHHGATGIAIKGDGDPGSFFAFALNPHRDKEDKDAITLTPVPFSDPKTIQSDSTLFVGVPLGTVPLLAETGTFKATLALANFGDKPATIKVKFATTPDSDSPKSTATTVESLRLPAGSTQTLKLNDLLASSSLKNSFVVESDAAHGQVGAKLFSYNEAANIRSDQLDKDQKHPENAGLHPWTLEQGNDSTLLLFNPYGQSNEFNLHVAAGKTQWQKTYKLQAFETALVSLHQLQSEAVKDDFGVVLPRDVLYGQLDWSNVSGPQGTGRMLISNRDTRMARSFGCASYYELCGVSISPSGTQNTAVPGSVYFSDSVAICWAYSYGVCSGGGGYYSSSLSRYWNANGPLTGAGNCAGYSSCEIGVPSAGTGYVSESVSDYYGCYETSNQVQVNGKPTISGSNTVWWFNGQTPSGYATTITLSSSGGPSTTWSIQKGSSMIQLSASTGASINVTSSGTSFSAGATDIAIIATVDQASSDPFYITTRRPYQLIAGPVSDNCDPTFGYTDYLEYHIEDQMNDPLPSVVPISEDWTTGVLPDYSGTNWRQGPPSGNVTDPSASFSDEIQGENINLPPNPPTACPGVGSAVVHWGQEWRVGSQTPGQGARVQTDTLQKYPNYATHLNIVSPAP